MKHYPEELKQQVRQEYENGASMNSLSRKCNFNRYSIQSWCGKRPEANLRQAAPLKKGHPSAEKTLEDYKQES